MADLISQIRKELKNKSDEKTKKSGQSFFKESVKMHGVKTSVVSQIAKKFFLKIKNLEKPEIFNLCEKLWQSGFLEESFIACQWSYRLHKNYEANDLAVFEKWLKNYISNWASCDTFCNHTIGELIIMYPGKISTLKKWAKSSNRWVRRGAAVSLIIPAKKGLFLKDVFQISDNLLTDKDDLVQKGYGWMLKAASQAHQKPVFDYVMTKKTIMPRTALRYAIEKMPPALRKKAMAK